MPDNIIFVYVTVPSAEDALRIGKDLLESGLAACVNVLDGMRSAYMWEGRMETSEEAVLIVKSRQGLFGEISSKVKDLHGYSTPCIVSFRADEVEGSFHEWLLDNISSNNHPA